MTESRPPLLNAGRQWIWEQLVGFSHRLIVQDPTGAAHIHGPAAQPASINGIESTKPSRLAPQGSPEAVVRSAGSGARPPRSTHGYWQRGGAQVSQLITKEGAPAGTRLKQEFPKQDDVNITMRWPQMFLSTSTFFIISLQLYLALPS